VAWNRHDPDAIAASRADDAQFITVNGAWTTSRQGFRESGMQRCTARTAVRGPSARRSPEVKVTFVTPDVESWPHAVLDQGEAMHRCTGQEDRESVGTRVRARSDGRCAHRATQNNTDVRHGRRH